MKFGNSEPFIRAFKYRLLAFWDKSNNEDTLVISTHVFTKKTDKVPEQEINPANRMRTKYFEDKEKSKTISR